MNRGDRVLANLIFYKENPKCSRVGKDYLTRVEGFGFLFGFKRRNFTQLDVRANYFSVPIS